MNLQLDEKLALVTGSSAGIGYAIAEGLAREGASVVLNGRVAPRLEQAVDAIRKKYPESKVEGFVGLRSGPKWRDMKYPPVLVQRRSANLCWARWASAWSDIRSIRPRRDFNCRYCRMAAR